MKVSAVADVDALGFCGMSHCGEQNFLTDRQLHFILCCRFLGAGKPQALCSIFPGEHLSLITAQLPLGVCRGSVPPPVTALPGISSLEYPSVFIPLPRFLSYVSHQCSSVSRDLAAVTLQVGGIFCFLPSILRDRQLM